MFENIRYNVELNCVMVRWDDVRYYIDLNNMHTEIDIRDGDGWWWKAATIENDDAIKM
jgi:hypothetical protein